MTERELARRLADAERTIASLQTELLETNRGMMALMAELEEKNEEIKAVSQQLWQAAKLVTMGELVASIAHELNNPLATITLRLESLLNKVPPDDAVRSSLVILAKEAERMSNLISNLLSFSRRTKPEIAPVDVSREIDEALELISYHLRKHSIKVVREFAPDLPKVAAEPQQLCQVFLNLFTNACDAMPGGGTLTIRTERCEPEQRMIRVTVSDTGVGIAPENLARVQEPFFTTKPEGKGTGLGLPICRRIVQEYGGTLAFTSQLGKGTTVTVLLPGAPALADHAAATAT